MQLSRCDEFSYNEYCAGNIDHNVASRVQNILEETDQ